jgi:cytochrome c2
MFFCCLCLSCERDSSDKKTPVLKKENLPSTTFTFSPGTDTVLRGSEGISIHIPPYAFEDKNGKPYIGDVSIELIESLRLKDMVKGDFETLSENGEILESSGMFRMYIKDNEEGIRVIPGASVLISIPGKLKEGTTLFYGIANDEEQIKWVESSPGNDSSNYWLLKGRNIFYSECAACHNVNLVHASTGPALAWVTKRWDNYEDLLSFTKNSETFAESGNSRARNLINWDPSSMTSFEHLADREIKAIYDYIEQESRIRKIDSIKDSMYFTARDSMINISNRYLNLIGNSILSGGTWMNLDRYSDINNSEEVSVDIHLENESFVGGTAIKLIIPGRNIIINFNFDTDKGYYTDYYFTNSLRLPLGEKAWLLAVTMYDEVPSYALKEIRIEKSISESLRTKQSTNEEILKLIDQTF